MLLKLCEIPHQFPGRPLLGDPRAIIARADSPERGRQFAQGAQRPSDGGVNEHGPHQANQPQYAQRLAEL